MIHTTCHTRNILTLVVSLVILGWFAGASGDPFVVIGWFAGYLALACALDRLTARFVHSGRVRGGRTLLAVALAGMTLTVAGIATASMVLFGCGTALTLAATVVLWLRVWRWLEPQL
jgi:hypothetical protein